MYVLVFLHELDCFIWVLWCSPSYLLSHLEKSSEIFISFQDTIGKVIVCLKDKKETVSQEEIRAVVKALAPDLRHVDEKEIVETIQNELKNPERRSSIKVNPRNVELNNVYENTGVCIHSCL